MAKRSSPLHLDLELDDVAGGAAGQGELAEMRGGNAFVQGAAAGCAGGVAAYGDFADEVVGAVIGFVGVTFHEGDGDEQGAGAIPEEFVGLKIGADFEISD